MKNDYNDPEREIFRTALDSFEMEPSEKFWNTAFDSIIVKENNLRNKLFLWKTIAITMACLVLFLGLNQYFVYNKITKIEKMVANNEKSQPVIENNNSTTSQNNSIKSSTTNNNQTQVTHTTLSSTNTVLQNYKTGHQTKTNDGLRFQKQPNKNSSKNYSLALNTKKSTFKNNLIVSTKINNKGIVSEHKKTELKTDSSLQVERNLANTFEAKNTGDIVNPKLNANKYIDNDASKNTEDSSATLKKQTEEQIQLIASNAKTSDSLKTKDSSALKLLPKGDSAAIVKNNEPIKAPFNLKDKLSISAFFTSGGVNDFIRSKDNNQNDNVTPASLKQKEVDIDAYNIGIKLGYDISPKWIIQTGCYYNIFSFSINQTVVHASDENGGIGYSIITSSGRVNIPYQSSSINIGDSIKVRGISSRGYLCIPLQFSYQVASIKKFGFYVSSGVAANFAIYQGTQLHWENTMLQEEEVSVEKVQELSKCNYTYDFRLSVNYNITNKFSLYIEPVMQGSITPINKNAPVITYPFFFAGSLGLTFHL
ncbi:MAG TPA: hypothetical protein VNG53_02635 [Bacteroidia bacterium]|nr:hypothetical protein [Bacteroidia bacterium]